jgi:hypothetical protein
MRRIFPLIILSIGFGTSAAADPCEGGPYAVSGAPHLEPGSIPVAELAGVLNTWSYSQGIQFDISLVGEQLRVDITEFPPDTQLVAGLFSLLQISRLVQEDFGQLVLVDGDRGLFAFRGSEARLNGCRTLWGVEANGAVVPPMVGIMQNVVNADSQRITPAYTGAFISDVNRALDTFNQVIAPAWLYSSAS